MPALLYAADHYFYQLNKALERNYQSWGVSIQQFGDAPLGDEKWKTHWLITTLLLIHHKIHKFSNSKTWSGLRAGSFSFCRLFLSGSRKSFVFKIFLGKTHTFKKGIIKWFHYLGFTIGNMVLISTLKDFSHQFPRFKRVQILKCWLKQ